MLTGLYSAASSMDSAAKSHDVIARNLAHANVPGYRRTDMDFESFESTLDGAANGDPRTPRVGVKSGELRVDFTTGAYTTTGRSLDVAINGEGFFSVEGPNGPLYTRTGVMHRDATGQLVATSGYPILGKNGPITIPANIADAQISIAGDGTIIADGQNLGQLDVVNFDDRSLLVPVGPTLFSAPPEAIALPSDSTVQQGLREESNVNSVDELVRMIIGMRHHEAAQRALRMISETMQRQTNS